MFNHVQYIKTNTQGDVSGKVVDSYIEKHFSFTNFVFGVYAHFTIFPLSPEI